jgi:hypothetical protein
MIDDQMQSISTGAILCIDVIESVLTRNGIIGAVPLIGVTGSISIGVIADMIND